MKINAKMRKQMLDILSKHYQGAKTGLVYNTPFELLIAVILSAQCTDVRVNIITRRIFPQWNSPEKMLQLNQGELEELIRDCGLFRSKAKNILAACQILIEKFQGQIPSDMQKLLTLPGVGRKTANVILSHQFGIPAIAVDTHVFRVANRTGLANGNTPEEIEKGLMKTIRREDWSDAHHWLIWHGRKICKARNPLCNECSLQQYCPSSSAKDVALKRSCTV